MCEGCRLLKSCRPVSAPPMTSTEEYDRNIHRCRVQNIKVDKVSHFYFHSSAICIARIQQRRKSNTHSCKPQPKEKEGKAHKREVKDKTSAFGRMVPTPCLLVLTTMTE